MTYIPVFVGTQGIRDTQRIPGTNPGNKYVSGGGPLEMALQSALSMISMPKQRAILFPVDIQYGWDVSNTAHQYALANILRQYQSTKSAYDRASLQALGPHFIGQGFSKHVAGP